MHDRQSKTYALRLLLGRKERLKNMGQVFGRDANPVVVIINL